MSHLLFSVPLLPAQVRFAPSRGACTMAATTGIRVRQHVHRDDLDGEVTLPCILDRLSRLEHESFSYHELLDDFASRRRVGPVKKELPAKHVLDPAEEADEIVQAYLSVNHGACSSR
ncbi:unnamed protein product, partial [Ectocarpus sp. 12 AP-2014]